jgi:hypothetical protein
MHTCNTCTYTTSNISHYKKHLSTKKHISRQIIKKNSEIIYELNKLKNQVKLVETNVSEVQKSITNQVKKSINDEVKDSIKNQVKNSIKNEVKDSIKNELKHDINTAIRKQNVFNKSIMTVLTQQYNSNPTLNKIDRDDFIKELELEYECKIDEEDYKLQQKIISDFKNKRLIDTVANLMLKFVKKDDLKLQSVFNTDVSRCNYATKMEKAWLHDKFGLKLREIILTPIIEYIIDSLQPLREEVERQLLINKKTPSMERSDFIMNNSHFLMEVNYNLVKKRTHDQILYKIAPQLHLDTKFMMLGD